ncbi:MAG: DUF5309 family protein [Deltaproteobacteria bacterium]|jgi:hypothetical protein|nr:DUF5309 family protein [Deltaproteobacteria bacterium]
MATILGLRDVANFTSDERPKNWREMILYLYPRSEQKAPLNALIAGMKTKGTDDPEFNWFEKSSPVRYTAANYSTGYDSAATSIVVDDGSFFRAGDLVRNESTNEVMRVTTDYSAGNTIVVARGWGSTATAITDGDELFIVGTAIAEGSTGRSALYKDPTKVYNYTQIFRYPLKLTETARATHLRTGAPYKDMKKEALDQHTIDMERAFIWGVRKEDTTGTEPMRSTGGILSFISTNSTTLSDGNLTYVALSNYLKGLFAKGSGEKLCFCGNQFLNVINQMGEARGDMNLSQGDSVYGLKLTTWITPFGTVYIKNHPLFNEVTSHSKMGLFIEPRNIIYRYLSGNGVNRDTKFLTDREANDEDSTEDEFLTECGLEVQHEATHGVLKNVNAYSA